MNVQRVTARGCFRIGSDNDLICAVPIACLGHGKVRVKSVFLDIGFQRVCTGIGHGKLGVSSCLDVRCLRGNRQRRFGDRLRSARLYVAELLRYRTVADNIGKLSGRNIWVALKAGFQRGLAVHRG